MDSRYDRLKLDNQLCFPLYAAAREIVKQYRTPLRELDLTYTQYICMMVLWEQRCCSVKELGARLFLDSGTLTPVLKSLESKGFVVRRRDRQDERVLVAEITEQGRTLQDKALSVPVRIAGCVPLTAEEAVELYRLLYKMLDHFREQNQ